MDDLDKQATRPEQLYDWHIHTDVTKKANYAPGLKRKDNSHRVGKKIQEFCHNSFPGGFTYLVLQEVLP